MFVLYRRLPSDLMPCFIYPDVVAEIFASRRIDQEWFVFADNVSTSKEFGKQAPNMDLRDGMLLLCGKDRRTILRGLAYSQTSSLTTGDAGFVIFEGSYDHAARHQKQAKDFIQKVGNAGFFTTAAVLTNLRTMKRGKGEVVAMRAVRNSANHSRLKKAGTYICIGPKTAESGAYSGHGSRYIEGGKKTYPELAATLSPWGSVPIPETNTSIKSPSLIERFRQWKDKDKAAKWVKEFELDQAN